MTSLTTPDREKLAREVLAEHMPGCGALGTTCLGMIEAAMLAFADRLSDEGLQCECRGRRLRRCAKPR